MGAKARFHVSIFPCCCTSAHDVAIAGFDGLGGLARLGLHCLGTVRARSAPCGYRPAAAVGRSSTAGVVAGALTSSTPVTCPQRLPILLPLPPLRAALCVQPGGLLDDQFVGRALLDGVAAQGGARLPQHFLLMAAAAAGRRVSIRARHCWRAMRAAGGGAGVLCAVSIRARHCWRAMPGWWEYVKARARVSIRARHCWRAMRCPACHGFWPAPVSIRARHCWRAMPCLRRRCAML